MAVILIWPHPVGVDQPTLAPTAGRVNVQRSTRGLASQREEMAANGQSARGIVRNSAKFSSRD